MKKFIILLLLVLSTLSVLYINKIKDYNKLFSIYSLNESDLQFARLDNFLLKDSIVTLIHERDSIINHYKTLLIKKRTYKEVVAYEYKAPEPINVDTLKTPNDSIYNLSLHSDTVNYDLKVKAVKLYWYKLNFKVTDNVGFKNTTKVDSIYIYPKPTWKDRIVIGPSIGIGYGTVNHKWDFFIGMTINYKLY